MNGKKLKKYQVLSYGTFDDEWENLVYTLWLNGDLLQRCELLISQKQGGDVIGVAMQLNYGSVEDFEVPIL